MYRLNVLSLEFQEFTIKIVFYDRYFEMDDYHVLKFWHYMTYSRVNLYADFYENFFFQYLSYKFYLLKHMHTDKRKTKRFRHINMFLHVNPPLKVRLLT